MLWSRSELEELVNNRLRELMRGTYTATSPTIHELLPEENKKQPSGFDYIIERTFMRPRDVIDFLNKCIKYADGKTTISREILRLAEDEYSHERLKALNDEWLENYGDLFSLYGFLKNQNNGFNLEEIKGIAEEYFLKVISNGNSKKLNHEYSQLFERFGNDFDGLKLLKQILVTLFEIGIVGIKIMPDKKLEYIYNSYTVYEVEDINETSRFFIHPMFHKALRIK